MTNFTIRLAVPDDAAEFVACVDAAFHRFRARGIALPDVSGGVGDDIARNVVIVAANGSNVLGAMILVDHSDHLHLANIAVHPDYGGRGIGKALLKEADEVAQNMGRPRLCLATHVDIPENVALYRHLGWTETHRTATKVMMEKQL